MSEAPWLTLIGLGEDGLDGLTTTSREALETAQIIMGPSRHLSILPALRAEMITWPVPFADGVDQLLSLRGRRVAVLASGDPFWFGAGTTLSKHLTAGEWVAFPGRSTFSLAASKMGWPLEQTVCLGLHAAPMSRLRRHLAPGTNAIVLLKNGKAVAELAQYLDEAGFAESSLTVLEALGGPRERVRQMEVKDVAAAQFSHPVCVCVTCAGSGNVLPSASGRDDHWFAHDGQITKRPVRALTLSALAPRPFQRLWDIGSGSGSIAIEWLLAHPTLQAIAIEAEPTRAEFIRRNASAMGVDHLTVVQGHAPDTLARLEKPDTVFVGGGLSAEMLSWLEKELEPGTRIVANAVTLETEALVTEAHARLGGELLRIELAQVAPLGRKRGWKASYPIVQWSHVL